MQGEEISTIEPFCQILFWSDIYLPNVNFIVKIFLVCIVLNNVLEWPLPKSQYKKRLLNKKNSRSIFSIF